ncbi:hypothetical protein HD806DRAFT_542297 [Xylariaceae sp. AK1471]|nr:hypothetical protein HD806DRAFT_542297 [Xylariaceae sp. AK1471]
MPSPLAIPYLHSFDLDILISRMPHSHPFTSQLFEDSRVVEAATSNDSLGRAKGREIADIPMCVNCVVSCENDDEDSLQKKALKRVGKADGGLSQNRWKATGQITRVPVVRHKNKNHQLGGGDGSRDTPPSSLPVPVASASTSTSISTGETIAKLHYRRSQDPRYAELECLVPLDSAIYVSILDPLNTPAFKPSPTKPIPAWMQWLPDQRGQNRIRESRPHSMLDVHFPPPSRFARRSPPTPQTHEQQQTDMVCPRGRPQTHEQKEMVYHREPCGRPPIPPRSQSQSPALPPVSPLPQSPPHRSLQRHKSHEYTNSDFIEDFDDENNSTRSSSPDSYHPTSASPPPYKRPSVVTDEPLKRPSSRLAPSHTHTGMHLYRQPEVDEEEYTAEPIASEGKGKSVAWHKTVAGDESDEICYESALPVGVRESPPKRCASPLADQFIAAWHRVVKPRTPPAQSKEFLDLYRSDKATQASLAMPGRRRDREIGKGCKKEK